MPLVRILTLGKKQIKRSSPVFKVLRFILWSILLLQEGLASETFILGQESGSFPLAGNCDFLLDYKGGLTIEDITSRADFINSKQGCALNFGYTKAVVWLRFSYFIEQDRFWQLKLDALEDVRVYIPQPDDSFTEIYFSRNQKHNPSPLRGGYFFWALPKAPSTQTIYIRFQHDDTLILHPAILDFANAIQAGKEDIISIFYSGLVTVMLLYNFLLFILLHDKSYIFYSCYIFFMLIFQLVLDGRFLQLLPAIGLNNDHLETIVIAMALLSYILFVRSFLTSRRQSPRLDRILIILCISLFLHLPLAFILPFFVRTVSLIILGVITVLLILALIIISIRREYKPAYYFLAAWLVLATSLMVFTLRNLGLLPDFILTSNSLQIGSGVETVLLAFALAFRINLLQNEKAEALEKSLANRLLAERFQRNYQALFNTAPVGIALIARDGSYLTTNQVYCQMYECREADLKQTTLFQAVYPAAQQSSEQVFWESLVLKNSQGIISFERTNHTLRGKSLEVRYYVTLLKDENTDTTNILCCVEDISEYKRLLQQLTQSLKEKEILLKEIHHRVKNNLQIIISLFRLKSREIPDARIQQLFDVTTNRIRAIANVHNRVYLSPDVSRIEAQGFIDSTIKQNLCYQHLAEGTVRLELDIEPCELPVDIALPLALILNELTTNACQHSFVPGQVLTLAIALKRIAAPDGKGRNFFELSVMNDGQSLPPDLDLNKVNSFGLNLVLTLVSQLDGNVELIRQPMTCFKIRFWAK